MCKPCGCFGSFFKMFQAQFQISLLSAHYYCSSKSTDGNSAMNLLKGYLHSINVLLAITTAIFLRESKLMPFHLLHRICLREALGRKDGAGGFSIGVEAGYIVGTVVLNQGDIFFLQRTQ